MADIIGWVLWGVVALFALNWILGLRTYVRRGTAPVFNSTLFSMLLTGLAVFFLLIDASKLHLLWAAPLALGISFLSLPLAFHPLSRPLVMVPTNIWLVLVTIGVARGRLRNHQQWDVLAQSPIGLDDRDDFRQCVYRLFLPTNINAAQFRVNLGYLENSIEIGTPTPSAVGLNSPTKRPEAYPVWFVAAFPDVTNWLISQCRKAAAGEANLVDEFHGIIEKLLEESDESDLERDDGRLNHVGLESIVLAYFRLVGKPFECALDDDK